MRLASGKFHVVISEPVFFAVTVNEEHFQLCSVKSYHNAVDRYVIIG